MIFINKERINEVIMDRGDRFLNSIAVADLEVRINYTTHWWKFEIRNTWKKDYWLNSSKEYRSYQCNYCAGVFNSLYNSF